MRSEPASGVPYRAHGSDSLDALSYIAIGRLVPLSCRLIQIGKEVPKLARVLDADEHHLVARNESLGVDQVFAERVVVPRDIRVLHRRRVFVAGHAASLPPDEAVQAGAEQVLSGFEAMADFALSEHLRATLRVAHTLSLRDQG